MAMLRRRIGIVVALLVCLAGCGGDEAPGTSYGSDAAGLKAFITDLRAAIASGDTAKAAAMTMGLFSTKAGVTKALRDGAGDAATKISAMLDRFKPKDDASAAKALGGNPERTEVAVHAATTEALAADEKGTPALREFPGGAREAAKTVLRPGLTFYEVELLEPGKDSGMKYHMFWHDGSGWKMLGPIWRALK